VRRLRRKRLLQIGNAVNCTQMPVLLLLLRSFGHRWLWDLRLWLVHLHSRMPAICSLC